MICQFTPEVEGDLTLKELNHELPEDVYPVGRLDKDSEGLLLLTNDNLLKQQYLNPKSKTIKKYWVQVEGDINEKALMLLRSGVVITISGKTYKTLPAKAEKINPPQDIPERNPPIRFRKQICTSWIEIRIVEGKNRQIRKMTAQTGFPTLRLIRTGIGNIMAGNLQPGELREITKPRL